MFFVASCPKLPSQASAAPAPRPAAPPPTAPKPALSFLPPPEMGDRPPPAPWAEELRARTNRQANHSNSAAQPFAKPPAVAPKSAFGGRPATSSVALAQKLTQNTPPSSVAPKPSAASSFPPPPAAPPAPPTPPSSAGSAPPSNHIKGSPFAVQTSASQAPPAAVPVSQPKALTSPHSSNPPLKTPPASAVRSSSTSHSRCSCGINRVLTARPLHVHSRRPPGRFLSQAEVFPST